MVKSNYQLKLEGIEAGAASIFIELKHGNIIIKHGSDGAVLKRIDNAVTGSWDKLWDVINKIESK